MSRLSVPRTRRPTASRRRVYPNAAAKRAMTVSTTEVIDGAVPSRRATDDTPLSAMPHGTM